MAWPGSIAFAVVKPDGLRNGTRAIPSWSVTASANDARCFANYPRIQSPDFANLTGRSEESQHVNVLENVMYWKK